jgi:hypothetical protein
MTATHGAPRLVMYLDYYLPGIGFGGPINSVTNLARALSSSHRIEIVTRDREFRTGRRYSTAAMDQVRRAVGVAVRYLPADARLTLALCRHFASHVDSGSTIYLNNFL